METKNTNTPEVTVLEFNMDEVNQFLNSLPRWTMAEEFGYEPISTLWQDFSIADAAPRFGEDAVSAIKMTFRDTVRSFRNDYKMMTELSMVLNHKIHEHHAAAIRAKEAGLLNCRDFHMRLASEYDAAWRAVDEWCRDNLKGEEYEYYDTVTD